MQKSYTKMLIAFILLISLVMPMKSFAKAAVYTISPTTAPCDKTMTKFTTYNKYTKQYYVIRSYLEKLEHTGGGTLILKKGTYTISNVLYVPSNVTIHFQNGVTLVKGTKTGTSKFTPATSMFQLIRPSKGGKKGVYGGYNGEKNISFIGEGTVKVDMKYMKDGIAIIAGHNQNVKIENIQFYHMNGGHFIEMDANKNGIIRNNQFIDAKQSPNKNKEAINLDTPDHSTLGWSSQWSKFDCTPNQNITIENNVFRNLDRSIGTHKYSGGKYHDHVTIRGNTIDTTREDAIRVMNWSNTVIENNTIRNVAGGTGTYRGILVSGATNPMIQNNIIDKAARPIQFMPWKNDGPGSQYPITYNKLSDANIQVLSTNKVSHTTESFIRINEEYNVFDRDTLKIPVMIQ